MFVYGWLEQDNCLANCEYFWNLDCVFSSLVSWRPGAGGVEAGGGVAPAAAEAALEAAAASGT